MRAGLPPRGPTAAARHASQSDHAQFRCSTAAAAVPPPRASCMANRPSCNPTCAAGPTGHLNSSGSSPYPTLVQLTRMLKNLQHSSKPNTSTLMLQVRTHQWDVHASMGFRFRSLDSGFRFEHEIERHARSQCLAPMCWLPLLAGCGWLRHIWPVGSGWLHADKAAATAARQTKAPHAPRMPPSLPCACSNCKCCRKHRCCSGICVSVHVCMHGVCSPVSQGRAA